MTVFQFNHDCIQLSEVGMKRPIWIQLNYLRNFYRWWFSKIIGIHPCLFTWRQLLLWTQFFWQQVCQIFICNLIHKKLFENKCRRTSVLFLWSHWYPWTSGDIFSRFYRLYVIPQIHFWCNTAGLLMVSIATFSILFQV